MNVGKKKALLVGIRDYPEGGAKPEIEGAHQDVEDMREVLQLCKFDKNDMVMLEDTEATKDRILGAFTNLLDGAHEGDSLVFYFTGYGNQVHDEGSTEPDKSFEILEPYDISFSKENPVYIADEDLARILEQYPLKGVSLDIILDSCYSGGMSPNRPLVSEEAAKRMIIGFLSGRSKTVVDTSGVNYCFWASSKEGQQSLADVRFEGASRSVFTYYFCKQIRNRNGLITRDSLFWEISPLVRQKVLAETGNAKQDPQLVAAGNARARNIFECTEIERLF